MSDRSKLPEEYSITHTGGKYPCRPEVGEFNYATRELCIAACWAHHDAIAAEAMREHVAELARGPLGGPAYEAAMRERYGREARAEERAAIVADVVAEAQKTAGALAEKGQTAPALTLDLFGRKMADRWERGEHERETP